MTFIDANLLVLYVVGSANIGYIVEHKRLRHFRPADHVLLKKMLRPASRTAVTPGILTEASNLASQIPNPAQARIRLAMRVLVFETREIHVISQAAVRQDDFVKLGLTDAALLCLMAEGHQLITADHDLHAAAMRLGYSSRNFHHYRGL